MNTVVHLRNQDEPEAGLRDRLKAMIESDRALTQAAVSRQAGINQGTFSRWLKGEYEGDNAAVEAKLQVWLDSLAAQRAAAEVLPSAPDYAPTPTAEAIISALRYAQIAGDIAVIYGSAGVGKTTAISRYAVAAPNVWHATMTPASAAIVPCLEEITEALGLREATGGAAKLHRIICRRVRATNGLLVIDEAQHLSTTSLDQIRGIHDATGIGIALVGNESVYARMTGGNRAAYLDRLYSRVGKKLRLAGSRKADIDALIDAWGVTDAACRAEMHTIASKPGTLRVLTKVLRLASTHARAAERALCCDDVRSAWRELGGES